MSLLDLVIFGCVTSVTGADSRYPQVEVVSENVSFNHRNIVNGRQILTYTILDLFPFGYVKAVFLLTGANVKCYIRIFSPCY